MIKQGHMFCPPYLLQNVELVDDGDILDSRNLLSAFQNSTEKIATPFVVHTTYLEWQGLASEVF